MENFSFISTYLDFGSENILTDIAPDFNYLLNLVLEQPII